MVLWLELNKNIYRDRILQGLCVVTTMSACMRVMDVHHLTVGVCACLLSFFDLCLKLSPRQSLCPGDDEITVVG